MGERLAGEQEDPVFAADGEVAGGDVEAAQGQQLAHEHAPAREVAAAQEAGGEGLGVGEGGGDAGGPAAVFAREEGALEEGGQAGDGEGGGDLVDGGDGDGAGGEVGEAGVGAVELEDVEVGLGVVEQVHAAGAQGGVDGAVEGLVGDGADPDGGDGGAARGEVGERRLDLVGVGEVDGEADELEADGHGGAGRGGDVVAGAGERQFGLADDDHRDIVRIGGSGVATLLADSAGAGAGRAVVSDAVELVARAIELVEDPVHVGELGGLRRVFDVATDGVGADVRELHGAHRGAVDEEGLLYHVFDAAPGVAIEPVVHELSMEHFPIGRLVIEDQHSVAAVSRVHITEETIKAGDDLREGVPDQIDGFGEPRGALVDGLGEQAHTVHRADQVEQIGEELGALGASQVHKREQFSPLEEPLDGVVAGAGRQLCEVWHLALLADECADVLGVELHRHAGELVTGPHRGDLGLELVPCVLVDT